jgi:glucose-1-phosphate adenylyltransferase
MFSGGFVDILAAEQTPDNPHWFQGTADAVRQSIKHIAPFDDIKYVLILSGDQLYHMDFRDLMKFHLDSGADITVSAILVPAASASAFGIMNIAPGGRVIEFREKPKIDQLAGLNCAAPDCSAHPEGSHQYLANMGIYLFPKKLLIDLLSGSSAVDFGKELFPQSIGRRRVYASIFRGYWTDIGTIRSFYEANIGLTGDHPCFSFYDLRMPIYTHARNLPGSRLNNSKLNQSIITEGCILDGAEISRSIIGVRSRIGGGATIKNSIVMGADRYESADEIASNAASGIPNVGIGEGSTIINAIIDKGVRIGENVSIVNARNLQEKDGENYFIRDGIIVVPKGAIICSGTVI